MRKLIYWVLTLLIALMLPLLLGEISVRLYLLFIYGDRYTTLDPELGWRATENYNFIGVKSDSFGNQYPVEINTNNEGFRLYGNLSSNRSRVLLIGDSFTHALDVSDSKTYYAHLQNQLDAEVFAYGTGGYGTLQEYFILRKFYKAIQPDAVILQFCSNDFINNYYPLEVIDSNNNKKRRPYLTTTGEIIYHLPAAFPAVRNWINHNSAFLYFVVSRVDKILAGENQLHRIIYERPDYPTQFSEAITITGQLFANIRSMVRPEVPIYSFSCDESEPYYSEFKALAINNDFTLIDGVPQAVASAAKRGKAVFAADGGHWSEVGHEIVADSLIDYFLDNPLPMH